MRPPRRIRDLALATKGFMPPEEGDALWAAALDAGHACPGLGFLEVGAYCGRSTLWLAAAARDRESTRLNSSHVSESRMPSSA